MTRSSMCSDTSSNSTIIQATLELEPDLIQYAEVEEEDREDWDDEWESAVSNIGSSRKSSFASVHDDSPPVLDRETSRRGDRSSVGLEELISATLILERNEKLLFQADQASPILPVKYVKFRTNRSPRQDGNSIPRVASFSSTELCSLDIEALMIEIEQEAERQLSERRVNDAKARKRLSYSGSAVKRSSGMGGMKSRRSSKDGSLEETWISFFNSTTVPSLSSSKSGRISPTPKSSSSPRRTSVIFPSHKTSTTPFPSKPVPSNRPRPLSPSQIRPFPLNLSSSNTIRIPLSPIMSSPTFSPLSEEPSSPRTSFSSPPLSSPMIFSSSTNSRNSISSVSTSNRTFRWSTSSGSTNPSSAGSDWAPSARFRSNSNDSFGSKTDGRNFEGFFEGVKAKEKNLGSNHLFTSRKTSSGSTGMGMSRSGSSNSLSSRREGVNFAFLEENSTTTVQEEVDWSGFFDETKLSPDLESQLQNYQPDSYKSDLPGCTSKVSLASSGSVYSGSINSKKSIGTNFLKSIQKLNRSGKNLLLVA